MNIYKTNLENVLDKVFAEFAITGLRYGVVGNYENLPAETSNDVDIWVNNIAKAKLIVDRAAREAGMFLYMENVTANGSNNYYFKDDTSIEIVKIDLMRETAFKSVIPLVRNERISSSIVAHKNFYVVESATEAAMQFLYGLANFGATSEKYQQKIKSQLANEAFYGLVDESIGAELRSKIFDCIEKNNWDGLHNFRYKVLRALFTRALLRSPLERAGIVLQHLWCCSRRLFSTSGIFLVLTGIDGAGKSTVVESLTEVSDKYFAKNKLRKFYWRPFFLPPIAELLGKKAKVESANEYDTQGLRVVSDGMLSMLSYFVKYLYYITDFVLGKLKYLRQLKTGGLVVFDRYHFDNVIYPGRFGFNASRNIMRLVDRYIIPTPDITFYLFTDTDVMFERKREVDVDEIERQKALYQFEGKYIRNFVALDTGGDIASTRTEIIRHCLKRMSTRYSINVS